MISDKSIITLFPCCKIVCGKGRDAIYDLQREEYHLIPHSLTRVLEDAKTLTWGKINDKYKDNDEVLQEYLDFLLDNELIVIDEQFIGLTELNTSYATPSIITNAIIDIDNSSTFNLKQVIKELDELCCENVEIRIYETISVKSLMRILSYFAHTGIRDIEILIPYIDVLDIKFSTNLHMEFPRLKKMTLHTSPRHMESVNIHEEICIIYSSESISDESCCGVINPWYLLPKTELFIESQKFNTCLNKKVGIDRRGNLKNCPSANTSYGLVGEVKIADVIATSEFQRLWTITKDDIKVCKDCELRHMCQDCRVFIEDENDILSKPKKCSYNPISS